jgi:DNA transformation protein and related proteins
MSKLTPLGELLEEHLADLGAITIRRMFGGAGVYCDALMFAILNDEMLYLKVDAETIAAFEAEGLGVFTYRTRDGDAQIASYRRAPERIYDDPNEMREWARSAVRAAARAAMKAPKSRKATKDG